MTALERLAARLDARRQGHNPPERLRARAQALTRLAVGALFPQHSETPSSPAMGELKELAATLESLLGELTEPKTGSALAEHFMERLESLHAVLEADAEAIAAKDPAASSVEEVLLTYPGFLAISVYRFAHELFVAKVPLLPRLMTEYAHEKSGIDLHPGARIGPRFCIDHGTGVVVGETSRIGAGVTLYQSVTLGALWVHKRLAGAQRHPTLEDNVIVYAGATILGGETVVGRGSVIGGNAWVTRSVPPGSVVGRRSEVRTAGDEDFSI